MTNADALVGNRSLDNSRYCLAKPGAVYVVYLPEGGSTQLDLGESIGSYSVLWYDPRNGGNLQPGSEETVKGPGRVSLGAPPANPTEDWVILVLSNPNP